MSAPRDLRALPSAALLELAEDATRSIAEGDERVLLPRAWFEAWQAFAAGEGCQGAGAAPMPPALDPADIADAQSPERVRAGAVSGGRLCRI